MGPEGTVKVFMPKKKWQKYCCKSHNVMADRFRQKSRLENKLQNDMHNKLSTRLQLIQAEVDALLKELSIEKV